MSENKRITKIALENYRAFYGADNIIDLPNGENLLIYGENGSGKSSLFRAMEEFFVSSKGVIDVREKINIFAGARPTWKVEVAFDEFDLTTNKIAPNTTPSILKMNQNLAFNDWWLKDANLAKGFLTYRDLLKTHLVEEGKDIDFFDLFVNHILADYKYSGTNTILKEEWEAIEQKAKDAITNNNTSLFSQTDLTTFHQRLTALFKAFETDIEGFSKYFDHNVTIQLLLSAGTFDSALGLTKPTIDLKVSYFDVPISNHQHFLNEARLSALAISIYLASLKNNPSTNVYRILFLDDIFIGLDTGNRIPLLAILNDHFSEFQIFLTTYDRQWFEIARNHLAISKKWKQIELYAKQVRQERQQNGNWINLNPSDDFSVGITNINKRFFEKPLIIDPSLDYLQKSWKYYHKKDYPACANYQRKEYERLIKSQLQDSYRLEFSKNVGSQSITKLETLYNKLKEFYRDCNEVLPSVITDNFDLVKVTVLNPFSHDDLASPIYRQELDKGFDIINALRQLPIMKRYIAAIKGSIFVFEHVKNNYKIEVELKQNLIMILKGTDKKFLPTKFDVVDLFENGQKQALPTKGMTNRTLKEFYEMVCHYLKITPNKDVYTQFKDKSTRKTIGQLMPNLLLTKSIITN